MPIIRRRRVPMVAKITRKGQLRYRLSRRPPQSFSRIVSRSLSYECVHRLHHRFSRIPAHRPLQSFNRLQSHTRRDVRSQAASAALTPASVPVPTSSPAPPPPAQVSTTSHPPSYTPTHTHTTAAPLAQSLDLSETKQDVSLSPLVRFPGPDTSSPDLCLSLLILHCFA
jgi:hypothetical protein